MELEVPNFLLLNFISHKIDFKGANSFFFKLLLLKEGFLGVPKSEQPEFSNLNEDCEREQQRGNSPIKSILLNFP